MLFVVLMILLSYNRIEFVLFISMFVFSRFYTDVRVRQITGSMSSVPLLYGCAGPPDSRINFVAFIINYVSG